MYKFEFLMKKKNNNNTKRRKSRTRKIYSMKVLNLNKGGQGIFHFHLGIKIFGNGLFFILFFICYFCRVILIKASNRGDYKVFESDLREYFHQKVALVML